MQSKFITFFLLFVSVQAISQTDYDFLKQLDKAGLVIPSEKKAFLSDLKAREEYQEKIDDSEDTAFQQKYRRELMSEPHYPLILLTSIKKFTTSGTEDIFSFRPAPVVISKGSENLVAGRLKKYAEKLLTAKFISTKTANEINNQIETLQLRSEFEVTAFAASATEKEYFLSLARYKKFADTLLARDLITGEGYADIIRKLQNAEFRNFDEPLRYLKNLVIIDLGSYKGKPVEHMEAAYRETAKAFPGLDFDTLEFYVEQNKKESFEDFIVYNLLVSLQKGSTRYKYSSFFDIEYKNKMEEDKPSLPDNYYRIFNKILADQASPYRLHEVRLGEGIIGIVPMIKKQFEGLMWRYSGMYTDGYIDLSYENFSNKLTLSRIKEAILTYDSIGLLSHLNEAEKDSCIAEIAVKEINYYSDILSSFSNLVFEIDLEYGINEGQYKVITEKIADISKGHFAPVDIIDTYNYELRKDFDFGFTINGKKYSAKLKQDDDWLDLGFWDLIEKSMKEQDNAGKFYYLHPADGMRQIYLTKQQVEVLKTGKMIELDEEDVQN